MCEAPAGSGVCHVRGCGFESGSDRLQPCGLFICCDSTRITCVKKNEHNKQLRGCFLTDSRGENGFNNNTHFHPFSFLSHPYTHTSSHSARLPDNNPLSAVTALLWILNPPVLDKEDASDYVRNEKLQEMFPLINSWCHSSCISCTIVHPDWPQTPAALTTPGTDPGYICWTDAMRHG